MVGKYEHIINKYRHRFFDDKFRKIDVNFPEGPYLIKIYEEKQVKMNDLTTIMPYHKSHLTRAIQHLTDNGLILKETDPEDQRGYILSITDKGAMTAQNVLSVFEDWDQLIYSVITEEEKELMDRLYKRIYEKLREFFDEGGQDEKDF